MAGPIHRLSRLLYWITTGAIALLPLITLAILAQALLYPDLMAIHFPDLPQVTILTSGKALLVSAIGLVTLGLMLMAAWNMRGLYGRYLRGEILSNACARHIQRIGQALLGLSAWLLLSPTLQMLSLTYDNPPGERVLSIAFDSGSLGLALSGGLLLTIGWAMRDAARAVEENAAFV